MPIYNFKIQKAKKRYICDSCKRSIMPGEKYVRMFGCAEQGDSPYEVFEHIKCIEETGGHSKEIIDQLKKNNYNYELKNKDLKILEK